MKTSLRYREVIQDARRIVVKVGSRVLVQKTGRPEIRRLRALAQELAALNSDGMEVVLVSSGAIGAGMEALRMTTRPERLPDLQMAAAIGQCRLMARYDALFSERGCKVAQVLLTHDNFHHKVRAMNARRTIENLLRHGVIPIINENDAVADEEIRADIKKLGDNDVLAGLVAKMLRADVLILLTTVDGVRAPDTNGRMRRVRYIDKVNRKTLSWILPHDATMSRGGMATKLHAALDVARSGCSAVIADGRKTGVLRRIMNGEDTGTIVPASVSG